MGYHHTAREVWYPKDPPTYQVCDGSGEDPTCSDSNILDTSVSDHLTYMGGTCCCPDQSQNAPDMEAQSTPPTTPIIASLAAKEQPMARQRKLFQVDKKVLEDEGSENQTKLEEFEKALNMKKKSSCDGISDCGGCLDKTSAGVHLCEWCPYQGECHDVGSIYDPCPTSSCISVSAAASCDLKTCPTGNMSHVITKQNSTL